MGQRGAGQGELPWWKTINQEKEPSNFRPTNLTPGSFTLSVVSNRTPVSCAAGSGRVPSTANSVARRDVTLGRSPGWSRLLQMPHCSRQYPSRPTTAEIEAPDPPCPTAACVATRARAAAAVIALGLPFEATTLEPVFSRGGCPAFCAPTAATLTAVELMEAVRAATGCDPRCTHRRCLAAAAAAKKRIPRPETIVFNVMAAGGNGLGKSTLLHALFAHEEFSERYPGLFPRTKRTVLVRSDHVMLHEAGNRMRLTYVDTPGLGDPADHSRRFRSILDYIDDCYTDYFNKDTDAKTRARTDRRIHCCLYLIDPDGHDLQPFDVECMKELQDRVNVIPVIAKADTMSTYDCYRFKRRLLREIAEQQIDVYDFPDLDTPEEQQRSFKDRLPFAVVGFNTQVYEYGRIMLGRRYSWGNAEVETLKHNDFFLLRKVLLQIHLRNLKETTEVHYENYRLRTLTPLSFDEFENLNDSKIEKNRYYITFKSSVASSSIDDSLSTFNALSSSSSST